MPFFVSAIKNAGDTIGDAMVKDDVRHYASKTQAPFRSYSCFIRAKVNNILIAEAPAVFILFDVIGHLAVKTYFFLI